jgi:hypothetical protein
MFAIKSTIIDNTPKSKITHITKGTKNVVDFDFYSNNDIFQITILFEHLEEFQLDSIASLLNKFSNQILKNMHSKQFMKHVIDFNGKITDPGIFSIMLHASFTSDLKMDIFSELYKNICKYIETIETIVYSEFNHNEEESVEEEDEESESVEEEEDESDEYDPKDTISTEIHFLDNDIKKYKKRAQEQPSKKLKKHKELLRRRLMNEQ